MEWDDKAQHRGVSCIPVISEQTLSDSLKLASTDKIGTLRERIYRRLCVRVHNNNKLKHVVVQFFLNETFKYVFATNITATSDIEDFNIMGPHALDDKLGVNWWSRSYGKHDDCGNDLCSHEQLVVINFPMRVLYYYSIAKLKVSFSYYVRPSYTTITISNSPINSTHSFGTYHNLNNSTS